MKPYIIYTAAGSTYDEAGDPVDNCQVLGFVEAWDTLAALAAWKEENPELVAGFSGSDVVIRELVPGPTVFLPILTDEELEAAEATREYCLICSGTGQLVGKVCPTCRGTGKQ